MNPSPQVNETGDGPATAERWCVVGPTYPFRGGIARHTTLLGEAVAASGIDLRLVTFRRQYPGFLYKGESDRDPTQPTPQGFTPEPLLDSVDPRSWLAASRAIADLRPDVVVVVWWHPFFAPMCATLLRRLRRTVPGAVRLALCHNVLPHETSPVDRLLARTALRGTDGLVLHATSQQDVARQLLGPVPSIVAPMPPFLVGADPAAVRTPPPDAPVELLFFGLVREYKGLEVLLRAMPSIRRERPVRLTVAGEFWDPLERYTRLVDEFGIGDCVEVRPGFVPDAELVDLLDRADLMVAPYRHATQSAVIETALGAGLPVVASRVGGLNDQLDDGVDGFLVPPGDVDALADAVIRATEPATLEHLAIGARKSGSERTWDALVDAISAFAATLDHRGSAP